DHAEDVQDASLSSVDARRDIKLRRVSDLCRPRTVPQGGEHGWGRGGAGAVVVESTETQRPLFVVPLIAVEHSMTFCFWLSQLQVLPVFCSQFADAVLFVFPC
ncbi:unnamed protein product, partial [Sphacelaria rigidula]